MALFSYDEGIANSYVGGANMGGDANMGEPLIDYAPVDQYTPGVNMGGILGDSWDWVKKNPLIIVPPLWVGQKTLQAVPGLIKTARGEVQATIAPFRPPPPPSSVDAITSALTGSSSGASSGSSILPIALGAGALGLVLILALGRKKK